MGIREPSSEELFEEVGFKAVYREDEATWRHGARIRQVFLREDDNTYWMASYRLSSDGETNELREGLAVIQQVKPYEKMVTAYRPLEKNE